MSFSFAEVHVSRSSKQQRSDRWENPPHMLLQQQKKNPNPIWALIYLFFLPVRAWESSDAVSDQAIPWNQTLRRGQSSAADWGGVLSVLVRLEQERERRGVAGSGGGPLVAFQSASCPSKAGYFAGKQT